MEILNRNQRNAALWRLSGLYATTVVIMGIIVFQSLKSYRSRADAKYQQDVKAAVDKEKNSCDQARLLDAARSSTSSMLQDIKDMKQAQEKSSGSTGNSVQGSLNSANNNVQQIKNAQTTVKTIGTTLNELNPMKK